MLVEDCNLGSYQLQSLPSRTCLFTFFNEHNQGKFVLDIIVRISLTSLMSYPGEKDLQVVIFCPFINVVIFDNPRAYTMLYYCVQILFLVCWMDLSFS